MPRPANWKVRPLSEVTAPTLMWNPRVSSRASIRYVDVSGVSREELRIVADAGYVAANAPSRARRIVRAGDTIFATIRPTLRRIAQVPTRLDGEVVSTAFCVLRPELTKLTPDFLFFAVQQEALLADVGALETGASYPAVRDSDILSQCIAVPPLAEQLEIAAVLNLTRCALLHERECESAVTAIKRAAMDALFSRGLRGEAQKDSEVGPMPVSWHVRSILELCEIQSGGTPRKSTSEYWTNGDIPWVSGKDLKSPALDDAVDHITREGADAGSRIAPKLAVLLLVRGMGLAKDLPVAVINRPMAFNQDVKALVPTGALSGRFLRSAIYNGKDRLLSRIVPSAHGTMTLNLNDVETFRVACPPDPAEAEEIADILDTIDRNADLHSRKRAVLDDLFKALLHKLMTGEIRVTDLDLSALPPATATEPTS